MKATAQIFLSYARLDEDKVENLYQKLSIAGFKPWMDKKDILPGEQWKSRIPQAIRRSDFFLACLSAHSVSKRGFLQKEVRQALDVWQEKLEDDIYLIPVRLEDCEVPESLREFQWVNLFEEDGWARLVKAIRVGMERRAEAPTDGELSPSTEMATPEEDPEWVLDQLFHTRGSIVDHRVPFYVPRAEDQRILQLIRNRSYVTIVGSRQTGKTSLLCKLEQQLCQSHFPVVINLADYYHDEKNAWYEHLGQEMLSPLSGWGVPPEPQGIGYPTDHIEFRQFLETVGKVSNRVIVVMLDEVGTVPLELADDFFGAIRTIYDVRVRRPAYQKYVFVLAGATNPDDLISRENPNSPFNVSERIFMSDFDLEGTAQLVCNLERIGLSVSDEICERVHYYTGGHPSLTQKLCQRLVTLAPETLTVELVDQVADKLTRSGDDNLRHLRKEVTHAGKRARALLEKLLAGKQRRFDRTSPIIARLEVTGALKEDEKGFCAIRNEIYRRVLEACLAAEDQLAEQVVDEEEVESLRQQLAIHKRNLMHLEERHAKYGIDATPELLNRIEAERNEIERLKEELSQLEPTG